MRSPSNTFSLASSTVAQGYDNTAPAQGCWDAVATKGGDKKAGPRTSGEVRGPALD
ncbi:hypothetical protein GCM10010278_56010 [Streptomyces melanogenes]|nr:hypothetical protein GCM10010278_56010 [Streptomyces melanogenes]